MTGNEARALRLGLGLSARQLGLEIGTTESTIYRWEWRRDREVPRMYARALRDLVRERSQRPNGDADDPPDEAAADK